MWKLGITRKELIASLLVGFFGAVVSGLLVFFFFQDFLFDGWHTNSNISAVVMFVVGFICCFFAFKAFFSRVEGKRWQEGLKWGFIICAPLGASLGLITGVVVESFSSSPGSGDFFFLAFIGCIIFGFPIGTIVGLVFGPIFTIIIRRFNLSSKQLSSLRTSEIVENTISTEEG